jgi:hypothetical protein
LISLRNVQFFVSGWRKSPQIFYTYLHHIGRYRNSEDGAYKSGCCNGDKTHFLHCGVANSLKWFGITLRLTAPWRDGLCEAGGENQKRIKKQKKGEKKGRCISPFLHHNVDIFEKCLEIFFMFDLHLEYAEDDIVGNGILIPRLFQEAVV